MRILYCSEQPPLPPLDDGIRLPLHALVRELAGRHEIRILSLYERDHRDEGSRHRADLRLVARPARGLRHDVGRLMRAETTRRPLRADSLAAQLRPALREELQSFEPDVVHVVTGQIAAIRDAIGDRPAILAAQDAWYRNVEALARGARGFRRLLYRREVERVKHFERTEYGRYDAVVVVTQQDADALAMLSARLPLHVIPNGVDAERFAPNPATPKTPRQVMFHGGLYHAPNVAAARLLAEEVWPRVRAELPDASLVIVGRGPAPAVVRLDDPGRGVRVLVDVDDVRPFLHTAAVYAAPMTTGTGIKNKLLEALACGLPSVATSLAAQGLDVVNDRDLVLADDPAWFAAQVVDLLRNAERARRLASNGRQYVLETHDWKATAQRYERLYESASYTRRG